MPLNERHRVVLDARTATDKFPGIGRYVGSLSEGFGRFDLAGGGTPPVSLLVSPSSRPRFELGRLPLLACAYEASSLKGHLGLPGLLRQRDAALFHATWFFNPVSPRCPTVQTVYDFIPYDFPEYYSFGKRLAIRVFTRRSIRRAKALLCISEFTLQRLAHWYPGAEKKAEVIPLAVDKAFSATARESSARVAGRLGLAGPYVLYVGSNKPHKNLESLVAAWQALLAEGDANASRRQLVIAGPLDSRHAYGTPDSRRGCDPARVRFVGPVPEEDLPPLYAGADLFVFPSRQEGFGFPVLEAMACAAPVICGNCSSLPEVAGDAALLVPVDDVAALVAAIRKVLSSPALSQEMRTRSLQRAALFSWDGTAGRTLSAYERICAGRERFQR